LTPDEHRKLVDLNPKNAEVISPYFIGDDITSGTKTAYRNWIINFGNRSLDEAKNYKEAFAILNERVRPYRESLTGQIHETCFWKFWDKREEFFKSVRKRGYCFASPATAKYWLVVKVDAGVVCSHSIKLFALFEWGDFMVLQSTIHEVWAREQSGRLEARLAYNLSRAFASFPFPETKPAGTLGSGYYATRQSILQSRDIGLTDLYNAFHDPTDSSPDLQRLREMRAQVDRAVAVCYGWADLDISSGFNETRQGVRHTINESARRIVLDRLLELNHRQREKEIAVGLHTKKANSKRDHKNSTQYALDSDKMFAPEDSE
jgi:hypothetical protein